MNRGGPFNYNVPFWDSTYNGRSRRKLDNGSQFYGSTQRFPVAPHPNDFNRYPFEQPPLPLISPQRRNMYNNARLHQPCSPNDGVRPFFGRMNRHPRIENFQSLEQGPCNTSRMRLLQDYSEDMRPHFHAPFQNRFRLDIIHRPQQRPALLPLPTPCFNGNAHPYSPTPGVQRIDIDAFPKIDAIDNFQPMADSVLKGYMTVKNVQSELPLPLGRPISNLKELEQVCDVNQSNSLKNEDKYRKQYDRYPQLPAAAHNLLRNVDVDTEILAYFDAEIRLFHKKAVVMDTLAHVVFMKPSELGLTWILAFFKQTLLQEEPKPDILAYRRPINRYMNLSVIGNFSISLECAEQIDECAVFNFQNFQECHRFRSMFSSHKNIRKRPPYEDIASVKDKIFDKRSKYNTGSPSPSKESEPIAWITKLPPEIAKFHAAAEKTPESKKIRSSDDFIYDSSTFSNALNMSASETLNDLNGCGEENRNDFSCNSGKESQIEVNNNDEIMFTARNVCLLMKSDPDSVDYRSPGYGTLSVIKNENRHNQLDFTDNSGALKCRHYIDHLNIIKCEKNPGEIEFGCVWQAFAEIFNSPIPIVSMMHFKVVLTPSDSGRFMDAMDDSIAKANRLDRFKSWDDKKNEHSNSSVVRYSL